MKQKTVIIQFKSRTNSYTIRPHYLYLQQVFKAVKIYILDFENNKNYKEELKEITSNCNVYIESTFIERIKDIKKELSNRDNIVFLKANEKVIEFFNNKYECYLFLKANGFKQESTYKLKDNKLVFPYILKTLDGDKGEEVWKIHNLKELEEICENRDIDNLITQRYNDNSFGRDIRVVVINGIAYPLLRIGKKGSFKSNISLGGKVEVLNDFPLFFREEITRLTEALKDKFKSDFDNEYYAIDLFDDGSFNIIEMNDSPGLSNAKDIFPDLDLNIKQLYSNL